MLELLWLLLPVAAASGWWAARRDAQRLPKSTHWRRPGLSADYFRGLNLLLNEQSDKAVEVFIKLLEVDSETVELHMTLGSLFRRRGEVDRAIRIHQNLIARPTLTREQRNEVLLELGEDYMRAGLFDRAENLFLELADTGAYALPALRHLARIYEQEKEWNRAVMTLRKLESLTGKPMGPVMAQYYCELAEQARRNGDVGAAMQMIKRALGCDRNCVRASILQGDLEAEAGDYRAAIRAYRRVEDQDSDYLPEVIGPLKECYARLGNPAGMAEFLRGLLTKHDGTSLVLAYAELLREQKGDQEAAMFIADRLRRKSSIRGLNRLIELNLLHAEGSAYEDLLILKELTRKLLEEKPVYKCYQCGFNGKVLHWQCPTCMSWGSVKPIQGIEGE